jgi:hypothetical protein
MPALNHLQLTLVQLFTWAYLYDLSVFHYGIDFGVTLPWSFNTAVGIHGVVGALVQASFVEILPLYILILSTSLSLRSVCTLLRVDCV